MSEVWFYHLTQSRVEEALGALLPRALSAGWRVAVRGRDEARMELLDEKLWLEPEDSFLPHGLAWAPNAARQPVLLTLRAEAENGADCVMSVDGADVAPAEVAALRRAMILFDGNDSDALSHARGQWRQLTGAGIAAVYWSEESGRWQKKAEKRPEG